ncbi:hypothetical protein [uncultured Roseobacter sp.]|uniref:hypothetical protein n=1 Tax=uncultured Roseobacter sp. TaxID=114847 RepID=UPI00260A39D7|nr:hypothetical protein [uncultured Roseobacter sp.]
MPLIHTRQDIDDLLDGPTEAEEKLLTACRAGDPCDLGGLPRAGDAAREVRADVLRYLILGGCTDCPVQGWGVDLTGAYISGTLDLSFEKARKATGLEACRFAGDILALQAKFDVLALNGSTLNALNAQGVAVTGGVFLRGITATGEVRLSSAQIGGQLDCGGATFSATDADALNAQGVAVTGNVFLRGITATGEIRISGAQIGGQLDCDGATFSATDADALNAQGVAVTGNVFLRGITATGKVSLSGAQIDGQLSCIGATLSTTDGDALNAQGVKVTESIFLRGITATGKVSLSGAQIGGQLDCTGATFSATDGHALTLQGAHIRDGFFWRDATLSKGSLDLNTAHASDLVDDLTSWPGEGSLNLDGFTYDRIGAAPTDAVRRLDWLAKGSTWNGEFFPQPYTQLAKVLREMGHDAQARTVLAERERLLYREKFKTRWRLHNGEVSEGITVTNIHYLTILWSYFLQAVVGYGHRPFRSVLALLVLWLSATTVAHLAWGEGSFAPNSGPVLLSDDWQRFASEPAPANPALLWSEKGAQGQDWESFSPHAYAADLVIPIVDIGQTAAWAPSTTRGFWGWHLWWLRWVFTLAGWVVTALGAAAITGIIRRD